MFAIVQNGNIVQFVQPDTPFTVGDKQYSAGFIRNATPEEKKAAGVWDITYGEQATRLGDRNKSRAVGSANGRNPISIIVPCHRVVGSTGALTGFAGGLDTKSWLLRHEQGVTALPV